MINIKGEVRVKRIAPRIIIWTALTRNMADAAIEMNMLASSHASYDTSNILSLSFAFIP